MAEYNVGWQNLYRKGTSETTDTSVTNTSLENRQDLVLPLKKYKQFRLMPLITILKSYGLTTNKQLDELIKGGQTIVNDQPMTQKIVAKAKPFMIALVLLVSFFMVVYPGTTPQNADHTTLQSVTVEQDVAISEDEADIPFTVTDATKTILSELRIIISQSRDVFFCSNVLNFLYIFHCYSYVLGCWSNF